MLRVIVVDDEPLARQGMRQLLAAHAEVRLVGEAASAQAAAELIRAEKPDAIFLDIEMADGSGFDLLRMGGEGDRAGEDVDGLPRGPCARATYADPLGANNDGPGMRAMLVLLDDGRHAARDGAGHPVWGQPGAGQFGDADRHALAAEALGDPGDGRGDDLGVLVRVAADRIRHASERYRGGDGRAAAQGRGNSATGDGNRHVVALVRVIRGGLAGRDSRVEP